MLNLVRNPEDRFSRVMAHIEALGMSDVKFCCIMLITDVKCSDKFSLISFCAKQFYLASTALLPMGNCQRKKIV